MRWGANKPLIEERDLDAAVAAGILDAATRQRLVMFSRDLVQGAAGPDEEQFRLLTGFNDIFVTIAIGLLLFAVSSLAGRVTPVLAPVAIAGVSWGLAEYFTRQRRMALPSIVLLLAFVGGVYGSAVVLLSGNPADLSVGLQGGQGAWAITFAGLVAAGAAYGHWRRFMVPITVAVGAAALSVFFVVLVGGVVSGRIGRADSLLLMVSACGAGVFALAMWFDSRDLARVTRRTDVAFWLHLLAAPMIIHPVFSATGLLTGASAPMSAAIVILVYLVLTIIALAIDRRALLVSALGYVIYAIQALLGRGDGLSASYGVTALVIGLFLVLLSAAWRPVRARVLAMLPLSLTGRLPRAAT